MAQRNLSDIELSEIEPGLKIDVVLPLGENAHGIVRGKVKEVDDDTLTLIKPDGKEWAAKLGEIGLEATTNRTTPDLPPGSYVRKSTSFRNL